MTKERIADRHTLPLPQGGFMSTGEIQFLSDISSRLNSDLDINRVLSDVLALTVERVEASNGSILIFDEHGTVAHKILARRGMPPDQAQMVIEEVLRQGLAGWVVNRRQGAVVDDVLGDSRWISFPDDDLQDGSAIGMPLVRRDRMVGVLTLRHVEKNHFTADQLTLLSSIADQAVIAIENARLFDSVQAERARLGAIINGAGDAILATDQEGRIVVVNASARQALELSHQEDLSGRYLTELIDNPALDELWEHRENTAYPSTAEIPLSDGRTLHSCLTRVPDVGFVIVMQDITYLKELDRMKTEFVSAVSHDLRSPLQLILTYTSLLFDPNSMTEQQRVFVNGINRGVQKIANLIDDLLDLAKIETGVGMTLEECRLDRVIADIVGRYDRLIHSKGLDLNLDIPSDLPSVEANVRRIDQVLSNLVDNAVKYTLSGSITISASADERQVTVHVSDTGIGLMPQEQTRLFTKFYRAGNHMTEGVEGTGLGLVVAKSIVERYGGKVWVQSKWQEGSTFSFSLPRSRTG